MEGQIASNGHEHPMEVTREGQPIRVKPEEETEMGLYYLSNIDQNIAVIMKTVFFYKASATRGNEEAVEVARASLAKVLVPYHPLAGRLAVGQEGKLVVELTGEGVPFVVAQANFGLEELLIGGPHPETLLMLVYDDGGVDEGANPLQLPLLTFQVTKLRCGGFTVGMCINHCMTDGLTAVNFVNSWGHLARHGPPLPSPPLLDRSVLRARSPPRAEFPHLEFLDIDDVSGTGALYGGEPMERRAFVFDGEMMGRLKGKAMEEGLSKCSSFEALAAFVWRARCKALGTSPDQRTKLLFPVDGRSRFNPPLPNAFFGNGIVFTCSLCTAGELVEKPLLDGVKRVQDAIQMVTSDYMMSAIDYFETTRTQLTLTATLLITTWSKLSFHTMDFGWGDAIYFGPVGLPMEVIVFVPCAHDTKGIVVHLGLPASAMAAFERLVMDI